MGTSSSGGGAGNGNPLIPSWIGIGDGPSPTPPAPPQPEPSDEPNTDSKSDINPNGTPPPNINPNPASPLHPPIPNRYTAPRRAFNKFVASSGSDSKALRRALKGYSKHAAGDSSGMARRMTPSVSRVAGFVNAINAIKRDGVQAALMTFNLGAYNNKPLLETLAALADEVFKDTGKPFENTQDDSITKEAYANTLIRISEIGEIDLNNLTNENVEVMVATFIEETISQRVISDIGNKMTKLQSDPIKLIEIENMVYQMVSGLVRNTIMPEIIATQRGDRQNLEKNIENVYRIAFDVISAINE